MNQTTLNRGLRAEQLAELDRAKSGLLTFALRMVSGRFADTAESPTGRLAPREWRSRCSEREKRASGAPLSAWCHRVDVKLWRCERCKKVWYCGKDCRAHRWEDIRTAVELI